MFMVNHAIIQPDTEIPNNAKSALTIGPIVVFAWESLKNCWKGLFEYRINPPHHTDVIRTDIIIPVYNLLSISICLFITIPVVTTTKKIKNNAVEKDEYLLK